MASMIVQVTNPEFPFGGVLVQFPGGDVLVALGSGMATGSQQPLPPDMSVPDPLVLNEIHAGQLLYVGNKMRFVGMGNGGRLEVLGSDGVTWTIQSQWTQ
jgi:hypothetical protein